MKLFIPFLILCLSYYKGYTQSATYLNEVLQQHNYTIGEKYPPLSLCFKGKPISILGYTIQDLEPQGINIGTLDANGLYSEHNSEIRDFISTDNEFRIPLNDTQGINPSIFYNVIAKNKEVFGFTAYWLIDYKVTPSNINLLTEKITSYLFPSLKGKIKLEDQWEYIVDNSIFTEKWKVHAPQENRQSYWSLSYQVTINPLPNKKQ
ncbi:MAG: hypothetical protein LBI72_12750 [Flavobacteriaceae bacterium]|jgi:hypothetical protein|nr:hypothetical protein [Flavobacteriaceae bacterium]